MSTKGLRHMREAVSDQVKRLEKQAVRVADDMLDDLALILILRASLKGSEAEKVTVVDAVQAAMHETYGRAINDCGEIMRRLKEATKGDRSYAFGVAEKSLKDLRERHDKSFVPFSEDLPT